MGNIGDYWREHKEYSRDRKAAEAAGKTVKQYRRDLQRMEQEERAAKRAAQLAAYTIRCECGRTFLDTNAHKCHKQRHGKKGHKALPREEECVQYSKKDGK